MPATATAETGPAPTDTSDTSDAADTAPPPSDTSDAADASDASDTSDTSDASEIPEVRDFTLIDADRDEPIAAYDPIPTGATIHLSKLPSRSINLRANTVPTPVGSVRFDIGEMIGVRIDDTPPYALKGDEDGNYAGWTPDDGTYAIQAVPFSDPDAGGRPGRLQRLQFEVRDTPEQNAAPIVVVEQPDPGARQPAPATWEVRVKAIDLDGSVERVDLGAAPGTSASTVERDGRWHGEIGPLSEGRHTIEAVARDDDGDIGIGEVRVRVLPGPDMDAGDPDTSDTSDASDVPDGSDAPDVSDMSDASDDTEISDLSDRADTSDVSDATSGCECSTSGPSPVAPALFALIVGVGALRRLRHDTPPRT